MKRIRIGVIGDVHLGKKPYNLAQKRQDIFKTFIKCIKILIDKKVDIVILTGDLFDKEEISFEEYLYGSALKAFIKNQIPIFFCCGNHDTNLHIFFQSIGIKNESIIHIPEMDLYLIKIDYNKNHKEVSKQIHEIRREFPRKRTILLLHQNFKEVMPYLQNPEDYLTAPYLQQFLFVINGHIHNHYLLQNILMPGSIERLDATNIEERKIFVLEVYKAKHNLLKVKIQPIIIPTRPIIVEEKKENLLEKIKQSKIEPIAFYKGNEEFTPEELLIVEEKTLLFQVKTEKTSESQIVQNLIEIETYKNEQLVDILRSYIKKSKIPSEIADIIIECFPNFKKAKELLHLKFVKQQEEKEEKEEK